MRYTKGRLHIRPGEVMKSRQRKHKIHSSGWYSNLIWRSLLETNLYAINLCDAPRYQQRFRTRIGGSYMRPLLRQIHGELAERAT